MCLTHWLLFSTWEIKAGGRAQECQSVRYACLLKSSAFKFFKYNWQYLIDWHVSSLFSCWQSLTITRFQPERSKLVKERSNVKVRYMHACWNHLHLNSSSITDNTKVTDMWHCFYHADSPLLWHGRCLILGILKCPQCIVVHVESVH
jgi:hypothetical protein